MNQVDYFDCIDLPVVHSEISFNCSLVVIVIQILSVKDTFIKFDLPKEPMKAM